jgi:hypothetical protein
LWQMVNVGIFLQWQRFSCRIKKSRNWCCKCRFRKLRDAICCFFYTILFIEKGFAIFYLLWPSKIPTPKNLVQTFKHRLAILKY